MIFILFYLFSFLSFPPFPFFFLFLPLSFPRFFPFFLICHSFFLFLFPLSRLIFFLFSPFFSTFFFSFVFLYLFFLFICLSFLFFSFLSYSFSLHVLIFFSFHDLSLTKSEEEKLNAFHRKQLRKVLNIKYPVKSQIHLFTTSARNTPFLFIYLRTGGAFSGTYLEEILKYLLINQWTAISPHTEKSFGAAL